MKYPERKDYDSKKIKAIISNPFTKPIEKEHGSFDYPIFEREVEDLAYDNLIYDYNKRTGNTMNILITRSKTNVVEIAGRDYWQFQVLAADTYDCIPASEDMNFFERIFFRNEADGMVDIDGEITDKKDLKLLRCLIDTQTGEYFYYPKRF